MHNTDADSLQLRGVQNFVVVHVVDLAVHDEIEVVALDGSRRRQDAQSRTAFEHLGLRHSQAVRRQSKRSYSRRSNSVLNRHKTAFVPIQTVNPSERAAWPRIYICAGAA